MTENEAIDKLNNLHYKIVHTSFCNKVYESEMEALCMAKDCLKEIQQYRAIGTVEELEWCKDASHWKELFKEKLEQYESIGTIDEFKALKEKYKNVKEDVGELLCSEYDDSSCPFSIHNEIVNGICSSISGNERRRYGY